MGEMTDRLSYNQQDAAQVIGVSTATLRRWTEKGIVAVTKIGGKVLYSRAELERVTSPASSVSRVPGAVQAS